jgi:hypothetical protein
MTRKPVDFGATVQNDAVNAASGTTIVIPSGTQNITETASGDTIIAQRNVSFTLVGSNDIVNLGDDSTVTLASGDQSNIVNAAGVGDVVNLAAGDVVALLTGQLTGVNIITLMDATSATIFTESNEAFELLGNSDTVNLDNGGNLFLASGDQGNTVNAAVATINTLSNVSFNLAGGGDTVNLGSGNTGDTVNLAAGDTNEFVGGNGDTINAQSNVSFTLSGSGDTINLAGRGDTVNANGATINAKSNTSFTLTGSGDIVNLAVNVPIGTPRGAFNLLSGEINVVTTPTNELAGITVERSFTTLTVAGNDVTVAFAGAGNIAGGPVIGGVLTLSAGDNLNVHVIANGETINTQSNVLFDLAGSGNTVNLGARSDLFLDDPLGNASTSVNVNANGDSIFLGTNDTVTLTGNGNTIFEPFGNNGDTVIGGTGTIFILEGSSSPVPGATQHATALLVQAMASFGAPPAVSSSVVPTSVQPQHPVIAASYH